MNGSHPHPFSNLLLIPPPLKLSPIQEVLRIKYRNIIDIRVRLKIRSPLESKFLADDLLSDDPKFLGIRRIRAMRRHRFGGNSTVVQVGPCLICGIQKRKSRSQAVQTIQPRIESRGDSAIRVEFYDSDWMRSEIAHT